MGLILSYLNYKEYDLPTNDCWDSIYGYPSSTIEPTNSTEYYYPNICVYDYYHIGLCHIPHIQNDYGIDILNKNIYS